MLRFTKSVDYGLMAMQYVAVHHQGLQAGFTFVNANAKSTCGCGTSFSV